MRERERERERDRWMDDLKPNPHLRLKSPIVDLLGRNSLDQKIKSGLPHVFFSEMTKTSD